VYVLACFSSSLLRTLDNLLALPPTLPSKSPLTPQNQLFLKELKFGIGDGSLHYYLFNWRITTALTAPEVGLILM
jgi:hypothetical protein